MARKRKKIWGANKKNKRNQFSRQQLERMSKNNAYKIMTNTDNLKSWGKTGWYKSKKLNEWFHYRSSIELKTLEILDELEIVEDFDTECFAIPYMWGTPPIQCHYIPDIILKTKGGKVFVVEVKPQKQLKETRNKVKWKAAKVWCWEQGCRFFVITENDNDNLGQILKLLEDKNIEGAQALLEWKLVS